MNLQGNIRCLIRSKAFNNFSPHYISFCTEYVYKCNGYYNCLSAAIACQIQQVAHYSLYFTSFFLYVRFVIVAKLLNMFHAFRKTWQTQGYCQCINTVQLASVYRLAMDVRIGHFPPPKKKPTNMPPCILRRCLHYSTELHRVVLTLRLSADSSRSSIPITHAAILHHLAVTVPYLHTLSNLHHLTRTNL